MNEEELAMAHALAENAGLTMSDIIRLLLREAHGRTFPGKQGGTKGMKKGAK